MSQAADKAISDIRTYVAKMLASLDEVDYAIVVEQIAGDFDGRRHGIDYEREQE